jgi:hypothetical protein
MKFFMQKRERKSVNNAMLLHENVHAITCHCEKNEFLIAWEEIPLTFHVTAGKLLEIVYTIWDSTRMDRKARPNTVPKVFGCMNRFTLLHEHVPPIT